MQLTLCSSAGADDYASVRFFGATSNMRLTRPPQAIAEDRSLTDRYTELKRLSMFLRSSPDFYKTDILGDSSGWGYSSDGSAFVTELRNPDTKAGFYIVRNRDSTSTSPISFKISVGQPTGQHTTIPTIASGINLKGRDSRVIVHEYVRGAIHLLYSTASVLYAGKIGSTDVVYLYGDAGDTLEIAIDAPPSSLSSSSSTVKITAAGTGSTLVWSPAKAEITVVTGKGLSLILSDTNTAGTAWTPYVGAGGADRYDSGSKSSIVVVGPYLVRNATRTGNSLSLTGDTSSSPTTTTVTVFAGGNLSSVTWNGQSYPCASKLNSACQFGVDFGGPSAIAQLGQWLSIDTLPELTSNFDDSNWTEPSTSGGKVRPPSDQMSKQPPLKNRCSPIFMRATTPCASRALHWRPMG